MFHLISLSDTFSKELTIPFSEIFEFFWKKPVLEEISFWKFIIQSKSYTCALMILWINQKVIYCFLCSSNQLFCIDSHKCEWKYSHICKYTIPSSNHLWYMKSFPPLFFSKEIESWIEIRNSYDLDLIFIFCDKYTINSTCKCDTFCGSSRLWNNCEDEFFSSNEFFFYRIEECSERIFCISGIKKVNSFIWYMFPKSIIDFSSEGRRKEAYSDEKSRLLRIVWRWSRKERTFVCIGKINFVT